MLTPDRAIITGLRRKFEQELFESVIPFWEKHSPDSENGGFFNCLDRDGHVYETTKHIWLQARQVFMFSKLYRAVEERPAWLEMARSGMSFLRSHAFRDDGRVFFSVTADGKPVSLQRKIFSECFYIMALAEYGRAANDRACLSEAQEEFARVWKWAFDWRQVGRPVFEGETASQNLAVPMILLNLIEVLADGDVRQYQHEIDDCIRRMLLHVDCGKEIVFENVAPDGSFINSCAGRHLNPGHAIEAGWFLQHWAQRLGREDLSSTAVNMVRWSHDLGWDKEWGGLYYFLDCNGYSPTQLEWNMKLWWPHCEALYGHLLNYSITRSPADWLRFMATEAYTFSHFPDPVHGEWYGYLDRTGAVTHRFKGGPYKGCFHVPRALWLCWTLLQRLENDLPQSL
ncbi:MAG TPA: N-acylglucosamine 2-epimerase [Candidatus Riflebacteria bacterium]|nr:N-acylglucosamine 2-epimerase [Candidatus Riflebacteria bacterium]